MRDIAKDFNVSHSSANNGAAVSDDGTNIMWRFTGNASQVQTAVDALSATAIKGGTIFLAITEVGQGQLFSDSYTATLTGAQSPRTANRNRVGKRSECRVADNRCSRLERHAVPRGNDQRHADDASWADQRHGHHSQ